MLADDVRIDDGAHRLSLTPRRTRKDARLVQVVPRPSGSAVATGSRVRRVARVGTRERPFLTHVGSGHASRTKSRGGRTASWTVHRPYCRSPPRASASAFDTSSRKRSDSLSLLISKDMFLAAEPIVAGRSRMASSELSLMGLRALNGRSVPLNTRAARAGRLEWPYAMLRVLVVDDEKNIRSTLALALESAGCTVGLAATAESAVAHASREVFDLALVDLKLAESSGLDLDPAAGGGQSRPGRRRHHRLRHHRHRGGGDAPRRASTTCPSRSRRPRSGTSWNGRRSGAPWCGSVRDLEGQLADAVPELDAGDAQRRAAGRHRHRAPRGGVGRGRAAARRERDGQGRAGAGCSTPAARAPPGRS